MKNLIKVFGLIAFVAIIGFSFAACGDGGGGGGGGGGGSGGGGGGGTGGTFTLTDIPAEYNGMYIAFGGENGSITIQGFREKPYTGVGLGLSPISNRKASFPLWVSTQQYGGFTKRYSGNDTINCELAIWDRDPGNQIGVGCTFPSITFSNGNATRSWNDGVISDNRYIW
jgi:hypothetical protein